MKPVTPVSKTSRKSAGDTGSAGDSWLTDVWTNRRRVSTSLWQCGGKDPTSGATAVSTTVFSVMFPFLKIVQIWIYLLHRRQVFCLCIHGKSEGRQSMLNSIFIVAKFIGY